MRVLLLGGTSEATALAVVLHDEPGIAATLSLAGATERPRRSALPTRIGGFGGADGLAGFLRAERVDALVDATHPFADRISDNAVRAAAAAGVELLRLERPEWRPGDGDRWIAADTMAAAAAALGGTLGAAPRTVLLTVGRRDLAPFRDRAPQHRYLVRCIDPPDPAALPPTATVVRARGPFAEEAERALLLGHGVQVMVAKNAGGTATAAKLSAARALGVPVVMVARPVPGRAAPFVVPDVAAALAWLRRSREAGPASTR